MINPELFKMADQLQNVVQTQMKSASDQIDKLENEEQKRQFRNLLARASAGKVNFEDAMREINKIADAGRN